MNWDCIAGNWKQVAGQRDQLVGKIQNSYGIGKDEAERQLSEWEARQDLD